MVLSSSFRDSVASKVHGACNGNFLLWAFGVRCGSPGTKRGRGFKRTWPLQSPERGERQNEMTKNDLDDNYLSIAIERTSKESLQLQIYRIRRGHRSGEEER